MIESINFFNVNFGDCFVLRGEFAGDKQSKMLVDFGSIQAISPRVTHGVNYELKTAQSKYLMVTHFHGDHYSGIKKIDGDVIFDEIYLPNFFSRELVMLQFTILSVLHESHPAYQIAYNLLSVIPDLIKHIDNNTKIIYVKRGERVMNAVDTFRILWPKTDGFEEKARSLYIRLFEHYDVSDSKRAYLNGLVNRYFSAVPAVREAEVGGGGVFYTRINEEAKRGIYFLGEEIESFAQNPNLNDAEVDGGGNDNRNGQRHKKLSVSLSRDISDYQNDVCICFDNACEYINTNKKHALFLSDLSRERLQSVIKETDEFKLLNSYYVTKVPHHGTKDYFVPDLPASEVMMVPNGCAKSSSWQITALYGTHYCGRRFICAGYYDRGREVCDYALTGHRCNAYNYGMVNNLKPIKCGVATNEIIKLL